MIFKSSHFDLRYFIEFAGEGRAGKCGSVGIWRTGDAVPRGSNPWRESRKARQEVSIFVKFQRCLFGILSEMVL